MNTYNTENKEIFENTLIDREELIDALLKEPFAEHFHFNEISLGEILKVFEAYGEEDTLEKNLEESFQKSKELFALLLQQLKEDPDELFRKKLEDLKEEKNTISVEIEEFPIKNDLEDSKAELIFTSVQAKEYWLFYQFLGQEENLTQSQFKNHMDKTLALCLCFSLELELKEKITKAIPLFLKHKNVVIDTLLFYENNSPTLHENLIEYIKKESIHYDISYDWLSCALLNSLQFLKIIENIKPSLIEMAIITMFFGQNISIGNINLSNVINLEGDLNLNALFFMLSKFQLIKNMASSPNQIQIDISSLEETFRKALEIVNELNFKRSEKAVA